MLAYAKCRRRTRLRPSHRTRPRCDDQPADSERSSFRRVALYDDGGPEGRVYLDESPGRRPDDHRAGARLQLFDRRRDRTKRPSGRDRLRAARSVGPPGRAADYTASRDALTGSDRNADRGGKRLAGGIGQPIAEPGSNGNSYILGKPQSGQVEVVLDRPEDVVGDFSGAAHRRNRAPLGRKRFLL